MNTLLDIGSDVNLIDQDIYDYTLQKIECEKEVTLSGLGLRKINSLGKCVVPVNIGDKQVQITFHILPNDTMPYRVILG